MWNIPRGQPIKAQPVMKCTFFDSSKDRDKCRKRNPVTLKLYDAKIVPIIQTPQCILGFGKLLVNKRHPPPFSYISQNQSYSLLRETQVGNAPLGSTMWIQMQDSTDSGDLHVFKFRNNIDEITFDVSSDDATHRFHYDLPPPSSTYPPVPILHDEFQCQYTVPQIYQSFFDQNIKLDMHKALFIENNTSGQSKCDLWHAERKNRLTASNFGLVVTRIAAVTDV